jgi:Family of unknown function (DUF6134)
MRGLSWWLAPVVVLGLIGAAGAADPTQENLFGTIRVDGKKIGQVHYTVSYDENGEVEELRTNASYTVLGFEVYHFNQSLHETWNTGELQLMDGTTNDDGAKYDGSLKRTSVQYDCVLNDKGLTLPHNAFPNSVWHYRITEQDLLFNLTDFKLMKVKVAQKKEQLKIDGKTVATERFDFTGDWKASLWFDQDKQIVKFQYQVDKHDVIVTLDPT